MSFPPPDDGRLLFCFLILLGNKLRNKNFARITFKAQRSTFQISNIFAPRTESVFCRRWLAKMADSSSCRDPHCVMTGVNRVCVEKKKKKKDSPYTTTQPVTERQEHVSRVTTIFFALKRPNDECEAEPGDGRQSAQVVRQQCLIAAGWRRQTVHQRGERVCVCVCERRVLSARRREE